VRVDFTCFFPTDDELLPMRFLYPHKRLFPGPSFPNKVFRIRMVDGGVCAKPTKYNLCQSPKGLFLFELIMGECLQGMNTQFINMQINVNVW